VGDTQHVVMLGIVGVSQVSSTLHQPVALATVSPPAL